MNRHNSEQGIDKSPSGISGLDEITGGGLPSGRPTLICGSAGAGKSLFAMTFLVEGAIKYNEPGVYMSFEETAEELSSNVASLGYDLPTLIAEKKIAIDHVEIERNQIEETGEYDLDGLFVRLGFAIKSTGAKRVAIDTIEVLFAGLSDTGVLRAELGRLFRWLKDQGVTAIITGEKGEGTLTRNGLEEYVSDCVILLDHRVDDQVATRRLRIVKYRGTSHGTNEYPFLIDEDGITVLPVTSMLLDHDVSDERVSSGVDPLDDMLGGRGFYRGSSVLVSGSAGSGKSTLAAHFVDETCRRGERCIYFAFEESPLQIMRNMRSVGIDLNQWVHKGLLKFSASRPNLWGLEMHLARMHKEISDFRPRVVVVDPIYNLKSVGSNSEVHSMLLRLIDYLKSMAITGMFVALDSSNTSEADNSTVSSLMDSWIQLRTIEHSSERNRGIYILKSRGMSHSNQIREFMLTDDGIRLREVYLGKGEVLTGSARLIQEALDEQEKVEQQQAIERMARDAVRRRQLLEQQISTLQSELENVNDEFDHLTREQQVASQLGDSARTQLTESRNVGAKR